MWCLLQVLSQSHLQPQQLHLQHSVTSQHSCAALQHTRPQQQDGSYSCSSSIGSSLHGQHWQHQQQQHPQQHSRGSSVCTQAAASSSAFQGPDGFSGGEKQSSFLSAFWRFLRPHTIRGTILGTSAVVTKVGSFVINIHGSWPVTLCLSQQEVLGTLYLAADAEL